MIKIWIDDIREPPFGYLWFKSVNEVINYLEKIENALDEYDYPPEDLLIEAIDLDHDAGKYSKDGGDYIEILNWMERRKMGGWPIRLHTANPVGRENMRTIIRHNNWKEVF